MNNRPQPIAGVRYPAQTKSFLNGSLMKPHAANIMPDAAGRMDLNVCSWWLSPRRPEQSTIRRLSPSTVGNDAASGNSLIKARRSDYLRVNEPLAHPFTPRFGSASLKVSP
jgi:hypothetical protein